MVGKGEFPDACWQTSGKKGLAHEDGNECHTFHKSCEKDGNGKNLTEGGRIAADGFGSLHANDTNADTGTENSQTGLGDSAHSGGVCEHVNHGFLCCLLFYVIAVVSRFAS